MLINPRLGQKVQVWYRESNRHLPYHADYGMVVTRSQGKPRNHLIHIFGKNRVVVPCGNLIRFEDRR